MVDSSATTGLLLSSASLTSGAISKYLFNTPVMVVCAGAKAILDLGLTLEYLETKGVPVIGYGTEELHRFYESLAETCPQPINIPRN